MHKFHSLPVAIRIFIGIAVVLFLFQAAPHVTVACAIAYTVGRNKRLSAYLENHVKKALALR